MSLEAGSPQKRFRLAINTRFRETRFPKPFVKERKSPCRWKMPSPTWPSSKRSLSQRTRNVGKPRESKPHYDIESWAKLAAGALVGAAARWRGCAPALARWKELSAVSQVQNEKESRGPANWKREK